LWVNLPAALTAGNYEIAVHNGFGGSYGWSETLSIEVKNETKQSDKIFNVKNMEPLVMIRMMIPKPLKMH